MARAGILPHLVFPAALHIARRDLPVLRSGSWIVFTLCRRSTPACGCIPLPTCATSNIGMWLDRLRLPEHFAKRAAKFLHKESHCHDPRYSRPEMVAIWSPETKFRIWFEIEAHACDALAELGVIPKSAAQTIWEKAAAPPSTSPASMKSKPSPSTTSSPSSPILPNLSALTAVSCIRA